MSLREIKTLTTSSKRILREFFNSTANTQYNNVRDIRNYMGLESNDDVYESLQYMYNEEISALKREKSMLLKEQKKRERINLKLLNNMPSVEFDEVKLKEARKKYQKEQAEKKAERKSGFKSSDVIIDQQYTVGDNTNPIAKFRSELDKKFNKINQFIYLQISQNGNIIISTTLENEKNADSFWWNKLFREFFPKSTGKSLFEISLDGDFLPAGSKVRAVLINSKEILPVMLKQKFRDGERHCVCSPIYDKIMIDIQNAKSEATRKRYTHYANKVLEYERKYDTGIPEEDMEQFARSIGRKIIMENIIGDVVQTWGNSSSIFHFINTRLNHLEVGGIVLRDTMQQRTTQELNEMVQNYKKENKFHYRRIKDGDVISCHSTDGLFVKYNENYEIYKKFNQLIDLGTFGYDSIKHPELHKLVKSGLIINSWPIAFCDEPNELDGVKHVDLKNAYTLHKQCKFYNGFLGSIHQYRSVSGKPIDFMREHIGIYKVLITKSNEFLTQFGIISGQTYTLPSVELLYFVDEFGAKMTLISGAFGSRMDFDYTQEMLEDRRYCSWAGKLGMEKDETVYECDGTKEWASHLKATISNGYVNFYEKESGGNIAIHIPNKSNKVYHHIFAFITAYTRINMMETMKTVKGQLVKCIMDGIYYRGEIQCDLPHKQKETIKHAYFKNYWYESDNNLYAFEVIGEKTILQNTICIGQGGSGKTFSVLTDTGYNNVLYVSPTNALAFKCREQYGCKVATLHKLIGLGIGDKKQISYKEEFGSPAVIVCDELTMCNKKMIDTMIEMYPYSLLIICGDIDQYGRWYQCRNGDGTILNDLWIPHSNFKWLEFTEDKRSLDNELKSLKLEVRQKMRDVFTDGGYYDTNRLNEWIISNKQTVSIDDAINMFQNGSDIWISGTHAINDKLLEKEIVSGYLKNKEVSFSDGTKRGSFTVHSFQGMTISDKRIFISLDLFEYAMLYTAISRARYNSQIVFVRV